MPFDYRLSPEGSYSSTVARLIQRLLHVTKPYRSTIPASCY